MSDCTIVTSCRHGSIRTTWQNISITQKTYNRKYTWLPFWLLTPGGYSIQGTENYLTMFKSEMPGVQSMIMVNNWGHFSTLRNHGHNSTMAIYKVHVRQWSIVLYTNKCNLLITFVISNMNMLICNEITTSNVFFNHVMIFFSEALHLPIKDKALEDVSLFYFNLPSVISIHSFHILLVGRVLREQSFIMWGGIGGKMGLHVVRRIQPCSWVY